MRSTSVESAHEGPNTVTASTSRASGRDRPPSPAPDHSQETGASSGVPAQASSRPSAQATGASRVHDDPARGPDPRAGRAACLRSFRLGLDAGRIEVEADDLFGSECSRR